ncbi:hypothetical protein C8F04DRAFT_1401688 [Mycena alexandri]|uniref:Uncharacterized protein n=1 Tax=Mycena alexandri TaxID=1745969 RepID=A0AAD6SBB8_9AGAR|nr:hypothetical protein C8F04DRAFT_1401688 [Mycena alexandri]
MAIRGAPLRPSPTPDGRHFVNALEDVGRTAIQTTRTPKYSTFSSTARIAVFDCAALSHSRRPPSRGYDYIISPSSLPPPTPSSPHFQLSAFTHHFPGTPPRFFLVWVQTRLSGFFGSALVLGSGGFAMKTSFPIVRVREDVLRGLFDPTVRARPWGFSMATGAFVDAFPSSAYGWSALDVLSGVVNHSPQSNHLPEHYPAAPCLGRALRAQVGWRATLSRSNAHHLPPPCPRTRESPSAFDLDGAHARRIPPPSSGGAIPPPCPPHLRSDRANPHFYRCALPLPHPAPPAPRRVPLAPSPYPYPSRFLG